MLSAAAATAFRSSSRVARGGRKPRTGGQTNRQHACACSSPEGLQRSQKIVGMVYVEKHKILNYFVPSIQRSVNHVKKNDEESRLVKILLS